MSVASNPTGPAPVTSARRGHQSDLATIRSTCSHALATMLAGSRVVT